MNSRYNIATLDDTVKSSKPAALVDQSFEKFHDATCPKGGMPHKHFCDLMGYHEFYHP